MSHFHCSWTGCVFDPLIKWGFVPNTIFQPFMFDSLGADIVQPLLVCKVPVPFEPKVFYLTLQTF
jgi:hypothetical protein